MTLETLAPSRSVQPAMPLPLAGKTPPVLEPETVGPDPDPAEPLDAATTAVLVVEVVLVLVLVLVVGSVAFLAVTMAVVTDDTAAHRLALAERRWWVLCLGDRRRGPSWKSEEANAAERERAAKTTDRVSDLTIYIEDKDKVDGTGSLLRQLNLEAHSHSEAYVNLDWRSLTVYVPR